MVNREARTESQRKWRTSGGKKKVEAYLEPELVVSLDAIVEAEGHRGRAEAIAALILDHTQRRPRQSVPKVLHVERLWDRDRCEFANANGSRCKQRMKVVVKRKVDGKVLRFAACGRHEHKSQPHQSVI